jgi:hypothetical protein
LLLLFVCFVVSFLFVSGIFPAVVLEVLITTATTALAALAIHLHHRPVRPSSTDLEALVSVAEVAAVALAAAVAWTAAEVVVAVVAVDVEEVGLGVRSVVVVPADGQPILKSLKRWNLTTNAFSTKARA